MGVFQARAKMILNISLVSCVGLIMFSLAPARANAASSAVDFDAIDAYVQGEMARAPIPGLALGIVRGDQIVHLKGFGVADSAGRTVTPRTPFILGSISKTFTALAIRQLAQAGRVDLDAPVQRYLSGFRVADPAGSAAITLRHLLDHTSGIPASAGQTAALLDERASLGQIVSSLSEVSLNRPPGTSAEYSNLNYLVLALVVEAVSAQPCGTYIEQHIFAPLQMRNSYANKADAQRDGLATGYRMLFGLPVPSSLPHLAAQACEGYLISTAEDMTRYMGAYLNRERYGEARVLTPTGEGWYDEYWNLRTEPRQNIRFGHSGGTVDFSAQMWIMPGAQWGVIVLMNTQPDAIVSSAISASSIATGVAMMLQGWRGETPAGLGFGLTYAAIDAILLLVAVIALIELLRLPHWRRATRRWRSVLGNLALAFLCLASLPALFGRAWEYWLIILPDVAGTLYVSGFVFLVIGGLKAACIIITRAGHVARLNASIAHITGFLI